MSICPHWDATGSYILERRHIFLPCSAVISHDFRRVEGDFRCFCEVITGTKHCGRNRIIHGRPCGTEFTLTRVNSVPHGRPWWIICILHKQYHGFGVLATQGAMVSAVMILTQFPLFFPEYSALGMEGVNPSTPKPRWRCWLFKSTFLDKVWEL